MAKRPAVKYIQFYTDGSAARQPEVRPQRKKRPLPQKPRKPRYVLYVQPLALGGILVAAVMLILMAVGAVRLWNAQQEKMAMADYVAHLTWENGVIAEEYEKSLDLESIRRQALALGMVPEEEAGYMEIPISETPAEQPQSFWERIAAFFGDIF